MVGGVGDGRDAQGGVSDEWRSEINGGGALVKARATVLSALAGPHRLSAYPTDTPQRLGVPPDRQLRPLTIASRHP